MHIIITIVLWLFIIACAVTLIGYTVGLLASLLPQDKPEPREWPQPTLEDYREAARQRLLDQEMYNLWRDD